jgi:HlyD family secretion protein
MDENRGMPRLLKRLLWIAVVLAVVAALVLSFMPQPIRVDLAVLQQGTLRVTADDDGMTRVRDRYTISAPLQGRLLRVLLEPGDAVHKGETVIAEFAPNVPQLLDARGRDEAQARLDQATAAVKQAAAWRKQADADLKFASTELTRVAALVAQEIGRSDEFERAQRDLERAQQGQNAAGFALDVARFGHTLAAASRREYDRLADDQTHAERRDERAAAPAFRLRAPVTGQVLRVFEESTRPMAPGAPILELGDVRQLEVVADYLTQDAVKVRPGMPVFIEGWGGEREPGTPLWLRGRVRLVEPSGFTKVSALGVEEQRVNIIVDPDFGEAARDAAAWAALGDGFRVELRVELWSADDRLLVPIGALFRDQGQWSVFRVEAGHAQLRRVRIGQRNGLQGEVLDGLIAGDQVVLYPSDFIGDGTPVTAG